jgi:hypothetical protein
MTDPVLVGMRARSALSVLDNGRRSRILMDAGKYLCHKRAASQADWQLIKLEDGCTQASR